MLKHGLGYFILLFCAVLIPLSPMGFSTNSARHDGIVLVEHGGHGGHGGHEHGGHHGDHDGGHHHHHHHWWWDW